MSWENGKRDKRKAENRRQYHEKRISEAPTPRKQLWVACAWLVSEAWQAGLLDQALDHVLTYIHDLRVKEETDDRHDYAA